MPITCNPKSQYVIKKNGHVETIFSFSQSIFALEVAQGGNKAVCKEISAKEWQIALDNVNTDVIILSVIANGRLLPNVTLKVKTSGISKNSDPFGDMGL